MINQGFILLSKNRTQEVIRQLKCIEQRRIFGSEHVCDNDAGPKYNE